MPDLPVEPGNSGRYPADVETRLALLEQTASTTTASLERRVDSVIAEMRADFRWLLGIMLGGFATILGGLGAILAVMAHGFHWL